VTQEAENCKTNHGNQNRCHCCFMVVKNLSQRHEFKLMKATNKLVQT